MRPRGRCACVSFGRLPRGRHFAKVEFGEPEKGPVTLARYTQRWLQQRKGLIADLRTDESRLRLHVLPYIGEMALEDIRPRHLVDLFRQLRVQGSIAPKTVHNIYGVLKALFRDAHLADLVTTSPCILTRHQLGENVDKDPTWRATAVFTRDDPGDTEWRRRESNP
ncbi:hypothetical protein DAT35_56315 [Vitiosangium sp. GDMCC 1.1324]|nr:hypothetical protein DAT35_56315 [Vitiosangium sp. GDMCC 1.1324]